MNGTMASDNTSVIYFYTGIDHRIVSYHDTLPDISLRIYFYPVTDFCPLPDISKGSHINRLPQGNTLCDKRRLLYSLRFGTHYLFIHTEQRSNSIISRRHPNQSAGHLPRRTEILIHQHDRSRRTINVMFIFGISQKS